VPHWQPPSIFMIQAVDKIRRQYFAFHFAVF
jgi:hypothetical protein